MLTHDIMPYGEAIIKEGEARPWDIAYWKDSPEAFREYVRIMQESGKSLPLLPPPSPKKFSWPALAIGLGLGTVAMVGVMFLTASKKQRSSNAPSW